MNAHFLGFEFQIQFVPSATHPIEPCCGTLAALLRQSQRLWPSTGTNSPEGLFVSGLSLAGTSPQRRLPCRAHQRLQALVVAQADSRLSESPATPLPAHRITAHSGASLVKYAG
jgi:hypothetical protein